MIIKLITGEIPYFSYLGEIPIQEFCGVKESEKVEIRFIKTLFHYFINVTCVINNKNKYIRK